MAPAWLLCHCIDTNYIGVLIRGVPQSYSLLPSPLSSPPAGGNGYINDYPTGRFLRDAKLYEIGAGTSEIRRLILGRAFNKLFEQ